jgi:hypothetical protein
MCGCGDVVRRIADSPLTVVEANTTTSDDFRCIPSLYSPMSTNLSSLSLSLPGKPNVSPLGRIRDCCSNTICRTGSGAGMLNIRRDHSHLSSSVSLNIPGLRRSNPLNTFLRLSLFLRSPSSCRGCLHHSCRVHRTPTSITQRISRK